jgi:sortase A
MMALPSRISRVVRSLGLVLVVSGVLAIVWSVVVWQWEDPFTALYTMYEQHELSQKYDKRLAQFDASHHATKRLGTSSGTAAQPGRSTEGEHARSAAEQARTRRLAAERQLNAEMQTIRAEARKYRLDSHEGDPVGRIIIPRLGLNMIVVNGTSESSLERGPGRDLETYMPGEGRLVYIAGHRTTYLAPFSHINDLRRGDKITLELPYATFVYVVTRHIIVPATDLAVLKSGPTETLALQACHPRFFATHRYIVYARPSEVTPTTAGPAYHPPG